MASRERGISLDRVREAAETVGRDVGARLVVLFGSAAREGVPLYEAEPGRASEAARAMWVSGYP